MFLSCFLGFSKFTQKCFVINNKYVTMTQFQKPRVKNMTEFDHSLGYKIFTIDGQSYKSFHVLHPFIMWVIMVLYNFVSFSALSNTFPFLTSLGYLFHFSNERQNSQQSRKNSLFLFEVGPVLRLIPVIESKQCIHEIEPQTYWFSVESDDKTFK